MIKIQSLTKKFNGRTVLNEINFQVKEGEVFGYLGPNGAGKTTTMRIILGLLKPTAGKVLVWGQNLGENEGLRTKVESFWSTTGYMSVYPLLKTWTTMPSFTVSLRERGKLKISWNLPGSLTERMIRSVAFPKG